jgi:hypothetical protein
MVYVDSRHCTHEYEVSKNSPDEHGKLYSLREVGHHATSTHRKRNETGDMGMDPHMNSSDTMDEPETYTQGMTPSSVSQSMAPTKTSGNTVVFGEYGFLCCESKQGLIGTGLH